MEAFLKRNYANTRHTRNDADANTWPGAPERVDGVDNDCDGSVDEGTDHSDDDGDGVSELHGDCDDTNGAVAPGATEVPGNGLDDDCDGLTDEDDDLDGDGFAVADGDCDDSDGWANPGLTESCDGIDNDCDGAVDEGCERAAEGGAPEFVGECTGCRSDPAWSGIGGSVLCLVLLFRRRRVR